MTGDVIVSLEGWNVLELADFVPSGKARVTSLGVLVALDPTTGRFSTSRLLRLRPSLELRHD